MKIRQVGPKLLHADRRTDRQTDVTKLMVAFLNFANAPKMTISLDIINWLVYVMETGVK